MTKIGSLLRKYSNQIIILGFLVLMATIVRFGPASVTYSGPAGQFEVSGPSEIGIAIGLIVIAVGIAGKLIGTKNLELNLSKSKLIFKPKK